jgi:hypothetical protein
MQDTKDYAELMKNIRNYCNDNINNKTKSILALIEFETNKNLVNDVKISQLVMNEIYTTNWTNEEKADFIAKTQSFEKEDDEEYIYADGYDYVELIEKIVGYCNEHYNIKTQSMITLIQTTLIETNWNNYYNLTKERLLFKNYRPVFFLVIDKMNLDQWTDNEKTHMFVNTIQTIHEFYNSKEMSLCDSVRSMSI